MSLIKNSHKSSMISRSEYNTEEERLSIEFKNNKSLYEYEGISKEFYQEFVKSDSVGKFFIQNIRDKFEFECITK